ncbi:MFS transporter [Paenibacillus sp. OK003]|uniref:MFS transporter n=1 Tax=Paenibacillus sp. OK003 TaxID=1884380 RepID=UPI0008B06EFD|nr:MFS transporter [Paenibacillus sp. OK003]SEK64906.1 drug resistance transporter, EmrB/QacA subfamily [Paenibacillus sp. OK003]
MNSASSVNTTVGSTSLLRPGVPTWIASTVACVCAFMVVMDSSIVNVALSSMSADLGLSATDQQWVVDIYLLVLGGFMLLASRASDIYGRKVILQTALVLFSSASLLGGLATNGAVLLTARAIQGFGGAALATSTLAVIVAAYPKGEKQKRAISLWAASSSLASAFGVIIGGMLTSFASWRWVMFVNVPIGIALSIIIAFSLRQKSNDRKPDKLDLPGAAAITLSVAAFIYGITQTVDQGWTSPIVLEALGASLVLMAIFVWIELRSKQPLIRLHIFLHRNVPLGMIMVLGLGATLTANMYFLSLTLQKIEGYTPFETGLALLPMAITLAVAAILSRRLEDAGFHKLPFFGGILAAAGFVWLNELPIHPNYVNQLLLPSLLIGGGLGLMLMTATHAVLAGIPSQDSGIAAGLQNTARQLGGALGIAVLVTVAHIAAGGQTNESGISAASQLAGYHAAFLACGVISGLSAFASLFLQRNKD